MNEFLTLNLADLEPLIAKSNCGCHFINPNKTRIILWKEVKEDNSEIYYLRIGIQKFTSYPLKDKNKAIYWRFNCFEVKENNSEPSPKEAINPDPITKYQQRLAKTKAINHDKANVESANTNSSEQSESTSH